MAVDGLTRLPERAQRRVDEGLDLRVGYGDAIEGNGERPPAAARLGDGSGDRDRARGGDFAIDYSLPLREARDAFERAYLVHLLKQADGSVGKLATMAGMERTHLYRKLRDLGIDIRGSGEK